MKIKLFALMSALMILFAGCADRDAAAPITDVQTLSAEESIKTEESTETKETPYIPEGTDFGGYDFRIIARGIGKWACQDMYTENLTGSVLNDAIYDRNVYCEDALKYSISQTLIPDDSKLYNTIVNTVQSGSDDYDLVWVNSVNIAKLAMKGMLADMNSISTLDLSHSWWDQRAVESLMINNRVYYTTGDISTISKNAVYVIAFNKKLLSEYNLPDVYSLVNEGEWTIDNMGNIAAQISSDIDGDGVITEKDLFGFMTYNCDNIGFLLSSGGSIAVISGSEITTKYNNDNTVSMLMKLTTMRQSESTYFFTSDDVANTVFTEGRVLFVFRTLINLNFYRDMETDYGILPTPKLNEEQDRYYCGEHAYGLSLIGIPVTAGNLERTGTILEVMSSKSQELVTPAFYEQTLKGKFFRDEDSGAMLDIIFNSRVYDFGYFNNWGGIPEKLQTYSSQNKSEFSSLFESVDEQVNNSIEIAVEAFSNLD